MILVIGVDTSIPSSVAMDKSSIDALWKGRKIEVVWGLRYETGRTWTGWLLTLNALALNIFSNPSWTAQLTISKEDKSYACINPKIYNLILYASSNSVVSVAESVKALSKLNKFSSFRLWDVFEESHETLKQLFKYAKPLLDGEEDVAKRLDLVLALSFVPAEMREKAVSITLSLTKGVAVKEEMLSLFGGYEAKSSLEKCEHIGTELEALLEGSSDIKGRVRFIRLFLKCGLEKFKELVKKAKPYMQSSTNALEKIVILEAMSSSSNLDLMLVNLKSLMDEAKDCFEKANILAAANIVPVDEIKDLIKVASPLLQKGEFRQNQTILKQLCLISKERRANFVSHMSTLAALSKECLEDDWAFKVLRAVDHDEMGDLIDQAMPLMKLYSSNITRISILQELAKVLDPNSSLSRSAQRADLIARASPIMKNATKEIFSPIRILETVRLIPLEQRRYTIAKASLLMYFVKSAEIRSIILEKCSGRLFSLFDNTQPVHIPPPPYSSLGQKALTFARDELKKYPGLKVGLVARKSLKQPINKEIALLYDLSLQMHDSLKKAGKDNDVDKLEKMTDSLMKVTFAIGVLTLDELPVYRGSLAKEGENRSYAEALTRQDSYRYKTFFDLPLLYSYAKNGYKWKSHQKISKEYHHSFYAEKTQQASWRALYNEYCDRIKFYTEGRLELEDQRFTHWSRKDLASDAFLTFPDTVPT